MRKLAILVIALMLMSPAIANANLLTNPGFEAGDTTSWIDEWGNNIHAVTTNPYLGIYAARNFADGGMYQEVSIDSSKFHKLTGQAYVPSGGSLSEWGTYIGMYWYNAGDSVLGTWETNMHSLPRDVYNEANSDWLVPPEDAVKARIRFGTWKAGGAVPAIPTDFDDFAFLEGAPVPEPSSMILLLTGLTGLFGLSFKKRK